MTFNVILLDRSSKNTVVSKAVFSRIVSTVLWQWKSAFSFQFDRNNQGISEARHLNALWRYIANTSTNLVRYSIHVSNYTHDSDVMFEVIFHRFNVVGICSPTSGNNARISKPFIPKIALI
jgi:hypothetical protein